MSFLVYFLLGIIAIVLIIVALFYLAKGLLLLLFWFLRFLPTMIKATIYWLVIVLLYAIFWLTNDIPSLPFITFPLLYLALIALIVIRRYAKYGSVFGASGGEYTSYVLNKKSKVIHDKYSDSAETISPHNRKEITSSEARDLINNNSKYHFKN